MIIATLTLTTEALRLWAKENTEGKYLARQQSLLSNGIRFVVTLGQADDWAAYYQSPLYTTEEIARTGDKLGKEAAQELFPFMASLRYRS